MYSNQNAAPSENPKWSHRPSIDPKLLRIKDQKLLQIKDQTKMFLFNNVGDGDAYIYGWATQAL